MASSKNYYSNPVYQDIERLNLSFDPINNENVGAVWGAAPANGFSGGPPPSKKKKGGTVALIVFFVIGWVLACLFLALTIWLGIKAGHLPGDAKSQFALLGYSVNVDKTVYLSMNPAASRTGYTNAGSVFDGSGFWVPTRIPLSDSSGTVAPRSELAATSTDNSYIVLAGGRNATGNRQASVIVYDPLMEEYIALPDLPTALTGAGAAWDGINQRIIVLGGVTDGAAPVYNTLVFTFKFNTTDLTTDVAWSSSVVEPLPQGLTDFCTASIGSRIIIAGGFNASGIPVSDVLVHEAGAWTVAASLGEARGAPSCTVFEGRLYIAGGMHSITDPIVYSNKVESYDPASGKVESLPNLRTLRGDGGAAIINGTSLLVFGGANADGLVIGTEAYSFDIRTWTDRAPIGDPSVAAASVSVDGVVYSIGGSKGVGGEASAQITRFYAVNVPEVFMYLRNKGDLEGFELREAMVSRRPVPPGGYVYSGYLFAGSGYWINKAPMPSGGRRNAATVVANGKVWIMGGVDGPPGSEVVLQSVLIYDPKRDSYSNGPQLPIGLYSAAAVANGNQIYLIGGATTYSAASPQATASKSVYTIDASVSGASWTRGSDSLIARVSACAAIANGRLYVFGGWSPAGNALVSPESWNMLATSEWQTGAMMPDSSARGELACASVQGRIFLGGGYRSVTAKADDDATLFMSFDPTLANGSPNLAYTVLDPLPSPRGGLALLPTDDASGSLIAVGGYSSQDSHLIPSLDTLEYLLAGNIWVEKQPITDPNLGASFAWSDGVAYAFGGRPSDASTAESTAIALYDSTHPRLFIHKLAYVPSGNLKEDKVELAITPVQSYGYTPLASLSRGSGQWSLAPSLQIGGVETALADHVVVVSGTDIFIIGGKTGNGLVNDKIIRYDSIARSYEDFSTMPLPRTRFAAAILDGRIFIIGGFSDPAGNNAIESNFWSVFDIFSKQWTNTSSIASRAGTVFADACATAAGDKLIVAGGYNLTDFAFNALRTLEVYDPASNTWTSRELTTARGDAMCTSIGRDAFIVGGWESPIPMGQTSYIYSPSTVIESINIDTLVSKQYAGGLRVGRGDGAVAVLPSGTILVMGGENPKRPTDPNYELINERPISLVEEWNPTFDHSVPRAPLNQARFRYGAAAIGRSVYAVGGTAACRTTYNADFSVTTNCPERSFASVERYADVEHGDIWLMYNSQGESAGL